MLYRQRAHAFPKLGHTDDEYEDSWWPAPKRLEHDGVGFSGAIADGATESAFAREWANLLTADFGSRFPASCEDLHHRLLALSQQWRADIEPRCTNWILEGKAAQGAHATLLAFEIEDRRNGRLAWRALAIGDSCLFVLRAGRYARGLPLTAPEQFHQRPILLSTDPRQQEQVIARYDEFLHTGEARPGDVFVFCTDALARFFLEQIRSNPGFARQLVTRATVRRKRFSDWLWKKRQAGRIRNDDLTLVTIEVCR